MRQHSYLNSAVKIIEAYDGKEPLPGFLKKKFASDKKYGSKDRKYIASLCYYYYRLGHAMRTVPAEERIMSAAFLCEQQSSEFLRFHKPEWNEWVEKAVSEKLRLLGIDPHNIFPWLTELSDGTDPDSFCLSFLRQPDLFLRVRPGKNEIVLKKLSEAGIAFQTPADDCIALPNATKLDGIIDPDKEAMVQDYHSQQVLNVLKHPAAGNPQPVSVWDCCAASGGKSLLAYDILDGKISLTVSDIRESILANLKKRFNAAGIKNYHSFIADLQTSSRKPPATNLQPPTYPERSRRTNFDLIICDAPCTGSGTWSRTPEQLYFFKKEMIKEYADKQKQIVSNVIPHLSANGMFIYITCSVFRQENEEVANFLKEKFHLRLLQMELLKGYNKRADSMFTAAFVKE